MQGDRTSKAHIIGHIAASAAAIALAIYIFCLPHGNDLNEQWKRGIGLSLLLFGIGNLYFLYRAIRRKAKALDDEGENSE